MRNPEVRIDHQGKGRESWSYTGVNKHFARWDNLGKLQSSRFQLGKTMSLALAFTHHFQVRHLRDFKLLQELSRQFRSRKGKEIFKHLNLDHHQMCAVNVEFKLEFCMWEWRILICKVQDKMMASDNPLSKRNQLKKRTWAGFYVTEN